jgi:hypothetical protein
MYPMKNLYKGITCLFLTLLYFQSEAQHPFVREPDHNRPALFQQLPEKINCRISSLESLLQHTAGSEVNIALADNFIFGGTIASVAVDEGSGIKSMVIRSTNFPGSAFSFSKITMEDGAVKYTGRIISFQHADAYELGFENGQYYFVKKGFYDLVNE